MTVYGPHCPHEECSWIRCDEDGSVAHSCRLQATCPHCGPDSSAWNRLSQASAAWMVERYGSSDPARLRELNVPDNVIETAELIRTARI